MKKRKLLAIILAALMSASILTACSSAQPESSIPQTVVSEKCESNGESSASENSSRSNSVSSRNIEITQTTLKEDQFSDRDLSGEYDEKNAVIVTCTDSGFKAEGSGVKADGSVLTISAEGGYIISGEIKNGRIVVDADSADKVQIVLNGVSITCSDYAPIYVKNADKVFLTLAKGTKNVISDGKTYKEDSEESTVDAAIFSKDDLVINGSGSLQVNGNMSHAIVSKDDLKITGGTITVKSVDSAVAGKDSVRIANADITITSGADGIKSSNSEDSAKGYIYLESGKLNITSEGDAIQAETTLTVLDAEITAKSGGGSDNSTKTHQDDFGGRGMFGRNNTTNTTSAAATAADSSDESSGGKGLKAGGDISVSGSAKISLDCADDTIHSDGAVTIENGTLTLASGDDGIHAEKELTVSGGKLTISKSYEGMEGLNITISGGDVDVTSSDDGLNATDGVSEGGMPGRGGMMNGMQQDTADSSVYLLISGGKLHVNAGGDGLDSNGTLKMTGGDVTVDGPTDNGNGALDSGSGATITGGTIVAVGSSGMAESFGTNSTQASILYNLSESHKAGETVALKDSTGKQIISFTAAKTFNSVVISAPELKSSGKYTLTVGSSDYEIEMTSVSYSNGGGAFGGMGGMNGQRGMFGGMDGENGQRGMFGGMDGENGQRELPDSSQSSSTGSTKKSI